MSSHLHQPLEELEEASKCVVRKGKRGAKRVGRKVKYMSRHVLGVVRDESSAADVAVGEDDDDDDDGDAPAADIRLTRDATREDAPSENNDDRFDPMLGSEGSFGTSDGDAAPPSAIREGGGAAGGRTPSSSAAGEKRVEARPAATTGRPKRKSREGGLPSREDPPEPSSTPVATTKDDAAAPKNGAPSSMVSMLMLYLAIYSLYHVWSRRSAILANQFPLSVVFILAAMAFVLGCNVDANAMMGHLVASEEGDERRTSGRSAEGSPSGRLVRSISGWSTDTASREDDDEDDEGGGENDGRRVSRTRKLARRGKRRIKRFGREHIKPHLPDAVRGMSRRDGFWTNLSHDAETEMKDFAEGPLMDHLLKYPDFRKRINRNKRISWGGRDDIKTESEGERTDGRDGRGDGIEAKDEGAEETKEMPTKPTGISMGRVELNNTKAESLESDDQFSHKVDPMCELRGMDLFLTDDPEEEIWRQPLLIQCGLRNVPTFIANMMFPFGNMTAYFKMPDWFDDWDNIPKEKEDDPPDVKALKRFLLGDDEYRNARAKVIPHVVDGPLAIRLIKPGPMEADLDGPRHPARWHQVPKGVDPVTRATDAAILECDIDCGLSNKQIRKIINMLRPHIESVTVDVALIVSTPKGSEIEEPSACLGLWRIEKVDFESAAVFPELAVEDAVEEVKMIMSGMEMDEVEVTA